MPHDRPVCSQSPRDLFVVTPGPAVRNAVCQLQRAASLSCPLWSLWTEQRAGHKAVWVNEPNRAHFLPLAPGRAETPNPSLPKVWVNGVTADTLLLRPADPPQTRFS